MFDVDSKFWMSAMLTRSKAVMLGVFRSRYLSKYVLSFLALVM